jgi:hypothetical protein
MVQVSFSPDNEPTSARELSSGEPNSPWVQIIKNESPGVILRLLIDSIGTVALKTRAGNTEWH